MTDEAVKEITLFTTTLASLLCGGFAGFYNKRGIPFPYGRLEMYALMSGPTVLQTLFGVLDGISISTRGKQITGNYPPFIEKGLVEEIRDAEQTVNKKFAKFASIVLASVGEGLAGAAATAAGYTIGSLMG